jgi:hypothetical protein
MDWHEHDAPVAFGLRADGSTAEAAIAPSESISWRSRSRTSVNEASFSALASQPGVEGEDVPLEHPLKKPDRVVAIPQDQPVLQEESRHGRSDWFVSGAQ